MLGVRRLCSLLGLLLSSLSLATSPPSSSFHGLPPWTLSSGMYVQALLDNPNVGLWASYQRTVQVARAGDRRAPSHLTVATKS